MAAVRLICRNQPGKSRTRVFPDSEVFARTGAWMMGKRMFDEGELNWPEGLFQAPVYVLIHEKRQRWVTSLHWPF